MVDVNIWSLSLTLLIVFAISRIQKAYNGKQAVGFLTGMTVPFQPIGFPGGAFRTSWWNPGLGFVWEWRHFLYKKYTNDTFSIVPFLVGRPCIVTANLDVAQQLTIGSNKSDYRKMDPEYQGVMAYWGTSVLTADGDVWKKHRRVVAPAFSNDLYQNVWEESACTFSEMILAEGWKDKESFEVTRVQRLTSKFTFFLVGRCGFGFPFTWAEPSDGATSKITFPQAMRTFIDDMFLLHLPEWTLRLPFEKFKNMRASVTELKLFMESKIKEKEDEIKTGGGYGSNTDIFTALVQANNLESDEKLKLDDKELISDVFIMLLAGHETTSTTLAATLVYLASYPDWQQEIYEQVYSVVGTSDRDPTFDDYSKLNKVKACFYEAMRLFCPTYILVRQADEDTTLRVPNPDGQEGSATIAVQKGTQMIVDIIGLLLNPKYYDDPEEFKPSRWYEMSNESEEFLGFGMGPRACIGRKFATLESVCLLTVLLRDYRIEPLLSPGETLDMWMGKVFNGTCFIAMVLNDAPLRFVRR